LSARSSAPIPEPAAATLRVFSRPERSPGGAKRYPGAPFHPTNQRFGGTTANLSATIAADRHGSLRRFPVSLRFTRATGLRLRIGIAGTTNEGRDAARGRVGDGGVAFLHRVVRSRIAILRSTFSSCVRVLERRLQTVRSLRKFAQMDWCEAKNPPVP